MAYELKIRRTAQAFLLAGYRLTEVHDQLLEMFNVDVPTSTLSDWKSNIADDEQIQAEAELSMRNIRTAFTLITNVQAKHQKLKCQAVQVILLPDTGTVLNR